MCIHVAIGQGAKNPEKSTSGGGVMFEGSVVKTWSSTQASVAQPSGEAEYYALLKAACEALGAQPLLRDMGKTTTITLWIDSSAAKGIASRTGLGKMRHGSRVSVGVRIASEETIFHPKDRWRRQLRRCADESPQSNVDEGCARHHGRDHCSSRGCKRSTSGSRCSAKSGT